MTGIIDLTQFDKRIYRLCIAEERDTGAPMFVGLFSKNGEALPVWFHADTAEEIAAKMDDFLIKEAERLAPDIKALRVAAANSLAAKKSVAARRRKAASERENQRKGLS